VVRRHRRVAPKCLQQCRVVAVREAVPRREVFQRLVLGRQR
jgi:hypothetical protein